MCLSGESGSVWLRAFCAMKCATRKADQKGLVVYTREHHRCRRHVAARVDHRCTPHRPGRPKNTAQATNWSVEPEPLWTPLHAKTCQSLTENGVHTMFERNQIDAYTTTGQAAALTAYSEESLVRRWDWLFETL